MLTNVEQLFVRTGADQADDLARAYRRAPVGRHRRRRPEHRRAPRVRAARARHGSPSASCRSRSRVATCRRRSSGCSPATGALGRLRDQRAAGASARGDPRTSSVRTPRNVNAPVCRRAALPLDQAFISPELVCASGVAELEYPRSDLATQVVFVGELTRPRANDAALPSWWPDVESSADADRARHPGHAERRPARPHRAVLRGARAGSRCS